METLSNAFFNLRRSINILKLDWNHLIILDACRYDVFKQLSKKFFPQTTEIKCITSPGSSTMEFVKKAIVNDNKVRERLKDVVFVNSNPMIDHVLGDQVRKIFYKYIPVWKYHWDEEIGTVKPEDTYYVALRAFIRHPSKKTIIWFLQPHYPYIDRRFESINVLGKEFMNQARQHNIPRGSNFLILIHILVKSIKCGCLCAGVPGVCKYMRKKPSEVLKAYMLNLFFALYYVEKLVKILPGKIIITSDHGEAFGEPLSRIFPLKVYGHPSRIRTPSLVQVPCLEVINAAPLDYAVREALKELIHFHYVRTKRQ